MDSLKLKNLRNIQSWFKRRSILFDKIKIYDCVYVNVNLVQKYENKNFVDVKSKWYISNQM